MNKKVYIVLGVVTILIIVAVFHKSLRNKNEATSTSYKDAVYILEDAEVKLDSNIKYFGNKVEADFNGDSVEDVVFLLTNQTTGSGTFYYLALAFGKNGGYEGANTIFIGDRIAPQTTEFRNGEIIVNYADRYPSEPMITRPSLGVSKYFKIENNKLVAVEKPVTAVNPTLCTKEQRGADFCAQVYAPVCAEVQIQCIKAPCNPIKETFSSSCEACKNQLVNSYTAGECKK